MDGLIADRYRIGRLLGTGAFASVHAAHDEQLDDPVAVKILAHNHALNPAMRERFITEGRTLRRVTSPHITAVHDLGQTPDGRPYLVLERANHGTLADRVTTLRAAGWTPTPEDLVRLATHLSAALTALDTAGIVHRDLGPNNILLHAPTTAEPGGDDSAAALFGAGEVAKVTDLGLCKDLAAGSGLTVAAGTAGFRPPEQRHTGTVDHRSDLWAAAAVLFWVATDRTADQVSDRRRALTDIGMAGPIVDAIVTALDEDPDHRPASATEWLRDVSQLENDLSGSDGANARRRTTWRLRVRSVVVFGVAVIIGIGLSTLLDGDFGQNTAGSPVFDAVAGEWVAVGLRTDAAGPLDIEVVPPDDERRIRAQVAVVDGHAVMPAFAVLASGPQRVVVKYSDGDTIDVDLEIGRPIPISDDLWTGTVPASGLLFTYDLDRAGPVAVGWHTDDPAGGCSRILIAGPDDQPSGGGEDCEQPAAGGHTAEAVHIDQAGEVTIHVVPQRHIDDDITVQVAEPAHITSDDPIELTIGPAGALLSREFDADTWFAAGVRLDTTSPPGCGAVTTLAPNGTALGAIRVCDDDGTIGIGSGPTRASPDGSHIIHLRFNGAHPAGGIAQVRTATDTDPGGTQPYDVGPAGVLLRAPVEAGQTLAIGYRDGQGVATECVRVQIVAPFTNPETSTDSSCDGPSSGELAPQEAPRFASSGEAIVHVKLDGAPSGQLVPQLIQR